MAISINHKGHKGGERPETATVSAGCTVRFRLRLTDGGVALDWTDPRVSFRDVCIWSGPRMGVIAHPAFSFDADDPTLLVVEHTTSTKDLPGLHSLVIDVSFMGWSAVHAVPAYVLKSPLYGDGGGADCGDAGTHDLTVALHDVSTTYLQRLIDAMLKLRLGENGRLTALEILTETLRNDVDDLTGRMDTAEGNIEKNTDAIKANADAIDANSKAIEANTENIAANTKDIAANTEAISNNAKATDALTERMEKAEAAVGTLTEGMTTLTQTVTSLVECCKSVNTTLADLEERVTKLEEGGTADPDPEPDPEPEPEYATLTITADPSDATVVINGEERAELTAEVGTEIEWSVSKEGYVSQSGTLMLTEDLTLPVGLEKEVYTITFNVSPADATLTVNGSAVALTDGKYTMTAKWGDAVSWSCERDGYIGQSGGFTATEDRTVDITLEEMVVILPDRMITFIVSPTDATLTVNGSEVTLSGGTYTMTAKDGDEISWSCEKVGYIQQSGSHTVDGDATITITLEEEVVEHYITVNPSELSIDAVGTDRRNPASVVVTSDGSWTADVNSDWLEFSQTSGEAGETEIGVSVLSNTETLARTATVTFTSEHGETATLNVRQGAASSGGGTEPDPTGTLTFDPTGTINSGTAFTVTPEMSDGSSQVLTVGVSSGTQFGDGESLTLELGGNSFVFGSQLIGSFSKTVESGVSLDGLFSYVAGGQPYNNRSEITVEFTYADETYNVSVYCHDSSASSDSDAEAYSEGEGNENGNG